VWTAAGKPLADLLADQGALRPEHRPLLDALADAHLKLHGGDPEKSLAALDLNRSTRESLANAGGPKAEATLATSAPGPPPAAAPIAPRPTPSAPPPATASGSGSCGPTPAAAWVPCSWRWTPSCTARWP